MTKQVQIINKKKFLVAALNPSKEVFLVYIVFLSLCLKMLIYLVQKLQIALLITEKVVIAANYLNYANIFSKNSVAELFKRSDIIKHTINLEPDKQPLYGSICNLELMVLKTLKIYIKINFANSFIHLFKYLAKALILFI